MMQWTIVSGGPFTQRGVAPVLGVVVVAKGCTAQKMQFIARSRDEHRFQFTYCRVTSNMYMSDSCRLQSESQVYK